MSKARAILRDLACVAWLICIFWGGLSATPAFGYDGGTRGGMAYDCHFLSNSFYDGNEVLPVNENEKYLYSGQASFASFTRFLAAKTGFYVTTDGVAIPATGYRAIGGPAVDRALSGDLMSQFGPTYVTFTDLSGMTGAGAKSVLQLKYEPSHYATFDTLQMANDLKIPGGRWNTSPLPEPIASTFPEFGSGGASQAITTTPIQNYNLIPFKKP
jgi:hypothetical protein